MSWEVTNFVKREKVKKDAKNMVWGMKFDLDKKTNGQKNISEYKGKKQAIYIYIQRFDRGY